MSNILVIFGLIAFFFIPFFMARLIDRLTGKHRRSHRNKESTNHREQDSKAVQEAKNDITNKIERDFHNHGGGPGV